MRLVIFPILFILFLTLKLTGVIAWSWWWVFSPVIAGVVSFIVFTVLIAYLESK